MTEAVGRRPGPAPSFTKRQVVGAALDVMAEEGLNAVSFRNVARRLGVNPMALYTYVRDKDELLAAMFDSVSGELAFDPASASPPTDQIVEYYTAARRVYLRNAELYRLVRRIDIAGFDLTTAERLCELLVEAGICADDVAWTQMTLLQLTIGNALFWASVCPDGSDRIPAPMTEALAAPDPQQFPHVTATARALAETSGEQEFTAAVRRLLASAAAPTPRRTRP